MVNRDLVSAKLADLADRVARVRRHAKSSAAELSQDRDSLDLVSFNLMLAVQISADIASHIIADEGWPLAKNLAQAFERLSQQGVISQSTFGALARAVGLRNVVAHGYAGIDAQMVHAAATEGLSDLQQFAREVATWTHAQSSDAEP
jgi:uncharacterized protein YutE (UPF0331/DUF86 family)